MDSMLIPVLAAGGGSIIFAIVLIISVISWIVNLVQGAKPKQQQQNRPRPRQQGQSELERFLQDVVGEKRPQEKKRPPAPKPRAPGEKKNKPKPQQQRPAATLKQRSSERPGAKLAQTHLVPTALGESVRSHVASHLESKTMDSAVRRDVAGAVQRDIVDAIQRDIGVDGTRTLQQKVVHPLVLALRNPQGVRQAIILAEILKRRSAPR